MQDEEEESAREGHDSHLVTWSLGLTQFPDQALFPNHLAVLDLRYNKITKFPDDMLLLTGTLPVHPCPTQACMHACIQPSKHPSIYR